MKFLILIFLSCLTCHSGIENISKSHNFSCTACHNGNSTARSLPKAHTGLIRNPSSPEFVDVKCGKCHEKEVEKLKNSLHSTVAKLIAITRFIFGAQKTPEYLYGAIESKTLSLIPEPTDHPESPASIVDDLLRRKCLRCHVNTEGVKAPGFYRASGCAACHVFYDNDGIYKGKDRIMRGRIGYAAYHRFTKDVPDIQCMHCHNGNRVGADYHGLFEHDYDKSYRSPYPSRVVYGIDFHYLREDLHARSGLQCVDCHKGVMEDKKVKCESCHGGFESEIDLNFVDLKQGKPYITLRTGRKLRVPEFKKDAPGHDRKHHKVACSLCHASWAYGDYGLHLVRIDIPDYYPWKRLILQADPPVTEFLKDQLEKPFKEWEKPKMKDFIDGKIKRGLWLSGWSLRRWEIIPMGVKGEKYAALRPMYQFFISYVDSEGYVIMDSEKPLRGDGKIWGSVAYTPHTTGRGRECFSCHGSPEALGLGYRLNKNHSPDVVIDSITILPPPVFPETRLLNRKEVKKLLNPVSNIIFRKDENPGRG